VDVELVVDDSIELTPEVELTDRDEVDIEEVDELVEPEMVPAGPAISKSRFKLVEDMRS